MEIWKIESEKRTQSFMLAATVIMLKLSLAAVVIEYEWARNETLVVVFIACLFLILTLTLIAAATFFFYLRTTRAVVIDPRNLLISIEETNRVGQRKQSFCFKDVLDAQLKQVGLPTRRALAYDIILKLKSGHTVPLFANAFFAGRHNKALMSAYCQTIGCYLRLV